MDLSISPENERFLLEQVELGAYASPSDGVDRAIRLLRVGKSLGSRVEIGTQQLDAGDYVEMDEQQMDEFFAELVQVAKGKIEAG